MSAQKFKLGDRVTNRFDEGKAVGLITKVINSYLYEVVRSDAGLMEFDLQVGDDLELADQERVS
ncbi:hypothetical protein [Tsukamurella paurometabola]|uniref:DUF2187 domain-containing protein n=1 Tax=Tsukamurella paurometabola TaxID=2061 RepID=A0A3P8LCD7_TSUPA|nr:hypothetical protein [Tsukamurella paurometabola]UEA84427.1 hypothetical protein LK411_06285 [Tsukamurella paurometabola]VDR36992.1 Uncharacterised protein [Tsukamurella paurometabola]